MRDNIIIDSPKLQTLRLRYTSAFLTLVFWALWFYLWIPLVTLFGWWFQVDSIQHHMVTMGGYKAFLDVLPIFLLVIVSLSTLLGAWALYNFTRFKGVDRRKAMPPVSQEALQEYFGMSKEALTVAQAGKVLVIHFDQDNKMEVISKS